eukprot:COSAG01_NODE_1421_length_10362_cov_10.007113_6_plen_164_part_00
MGYHLCCLSSRLGSGLARSDLFCCVRCSLTLPIPKLCKDHHVNEKRPRPYITASNTHAYLHKLSGAGRRFSHEDIEFRVEDSLRQSAELEASRPPNPQVSSPPSTAEPISTNSATISALRSRRKSVEDEMDAIGDDGGLLDLDGSGDSSDDEPTPASAGDSGA